MSEPSPESTSFVPVAAPSDATAFDCPLCGGRFSHGTLVCGSCPLNAGCEIIKCPSCGYQFPRRSKIVDLVRRVFGAGPAS
jgi:predicted RNA-binding Zn-ribbon protein involved in translation (DUF1610 family)